MPTGYTADIANGITFPEYAMQCARAFGACITMRDDPKEALIPDEFTPNDYHAQELQNHRNQLSEVMHMTLAQCEEAARTEYDKAVATRDAELRAGDELRAKYESMLEHVAQWQPPTPDHVGLKEFMAQQIRDSIPWDCDNHYYRDNVPVLLSGVEWRKERIKSISQNIAYLEQHYAEEVAGSNERTAWVMALRASLADRVVV